MANPLINFASKNIKNFIIDSLSKEWPVSAKKMYNSVKGAGISVSYQAVYKTLKDLEGNGIVIKAGKGYQLSLEWIKHLKRLSTNLENAYSKQFIISGDKPTTLTFETLWDMYMFLLGSFVEDTFKIGNKSICFQSQHVWHSLVGTDKEWTAFEEFMKSHKIYAVTRSNTVLDNILKKNWERVGIKYKLGFDVQSTSIMRDTVIIGDYIVQLFLPEGLIEEENRIYEKVKTIEDINAAELHSFFWKKYKWINVIIHMNKDIADQIRKETESYFK